MNELALRSDSVSIKLTPLSSLPDDIDSIRCSVEWTATGIGNARAEGFFYRTDLENFREALTTLYKDLKGEADIVSVEQDISISAQYSRLHIQISGFLTLTNDLGRLEFSFETDPSFLDGQ